MNGLTVKRLFDAVLALLVLVVSLPVLLVAIIGIRLTSPGPVVYRARRIGRDRRRELRPGPYQGREFTMFKLRTMRPDSGGAATPVTGCDDARVFPWGRVLRKMKIDELPQLVNVVTGEMSLVGPRPEAPEVVRRHYQPADIGTLRVRPGVTSPGTLYFYTHGEPMLSNDAVMSTYVDRVLPQKLAVDRVYLTKASFAYDVRVLLRTARIIVERLFGVRRFPEQPEVREDAVDAPR